MAYPNSTSYDFNDLNSTTLEIMRPAMADTFFKVVPVFDWLKSSGRVRVETGGREIQERLLYAKNTTVGAYSGYDPLNVAPTESITVARYNWRQYHGSVVISGFEEAVNSGEEALIKLLAHNIDLLGMSFPDLMDEHLLALASEKDQTRHILGLNEIVYAGSATDQGTLGGISRATAGYSWWRNQVSGTSGSPNDYTALVAAGDDRPIYTKLTSLINKTSQQKVKASDQLIVTTREMYELFERENRDDIFRTPKETDPAKIGWGDIIFKGRRIVWDEKVLGTGTTGDSGHHYLYVLSAPFLKFVIHSARNFKMTPFRVPDRQDARHAFMLFMGQLISTNNRHHGVMVWKNVA